MTKKNRKKRNGGVGPVTTKKPAKGGAKAAPAIATGEAVPLESRAPRRREPKPEKMSAKEQSAIAKKAARARLMERPTAV